MYVHIYVYVVNPLLCDTIIENLLRELSEEQKSKMKKANKESLTTMHRKEVLPPVNC